MTVPLLAGFECGHLGWNNHDLLRTTRHVPEDRMAAHYAIVRDHGLARVRDGLPWRHDAGARIAVARASGIDPIWDLTHFDPPPDPVAHALHVASLADPARPLWLCPVNEPSLYPRLCGMGREAAVAMALEMAIAARDRHPDVRILANDPVTGVGERQYAALDAMVASGLVDMIGVNYYPHTARAALSKVLVKTARRYGLPVLVAETSWHDGHPVHERRYPGWNKRAWLDHVLAETALARGRGARVEGVCWYPVVDCPPWPHPRSRKRWRHGLIREDASLDPVLAQALRADRRPAAEQLGFDFGRTG